MLTITIYFLTAALSRHYRSQESMFSLSLHELTACVYYKLAIERGLRGCNPEAERAAHQPTTASADSGGGGSSSGGGVPKKDSAGSSSSSEDYECKNAQHADVETAIR